MCLDTCAGTWAANVNSLVFEKEGKCPQLHTTDCKSYQELSFHPWCSHLLQYGVLSGRKEFIPCPTHHLILGPVFFKDTSILIQNGKISTSLKNEDGALEKCFCLAPSFETLTALQCQPCDCLLLQHLSHFYQTTKQILLPNFKTFFLMTEYQTTKNCDWYQQIKQFWLADNENYHR